MTDKEFIFEMMEIFMNIINEFNTSSQNKSKIQKIKDYFKKKIDEARNNRDEQLAKLKDFVDEIGGELTSELQERMEKKYKQVKMIYIARRRLLKNKEFLELTKVKKSGKLAVVISGSALATIATYSAFKNYRDGKKHEEQMCMGKTGKDLINCKNRISKKYLMRRLIMLKRAIPKCNQSTDPVKCKSKIDKEILKVQHKLGEYFIGVGHKIIRKED